MTLVELEGDETTWRYSQIEGLVAEGGDVTPGRTCSTCGSRARHGFMVGWLVAAHERPTTWETSFN